MKLEAILSSGKLPREAAKELGITRERVRQLMLELGIRSQANVRAERRQRVLTRKELRMVERLYTSGVSLEKIAESEELDQEFVSQIVRENRFVRKTRCQTCGKEIRSKSKFGVRKNCVTCARNLERVRFAERQRVMYKSDPEFRKRKLRKNREWKKSEAGRKWLAGYYARQRKSK